MKIVFCSCFFSCLLLLASCSSEQQGCKYGSPEAILGPDIEGVSKHSFRRENGSSASEQLEWKLEDLHLALKIEQSGCDTAFQRYIFAFIEPQLPRDLQSPECAEALADIFAILGQKDPKLQQWLAFAQLFGQNQGQFRYGEWQKLGYEGLHFEAKFVFVPDPNMPIIDLELMML